MDNFIKLPNNLIWSYTDEEYTLVDKLGDKVIYILPYLDLMTNRLNICNFSIQDMIVNANYKMKTGKNSINNQFKTVLQELQLREIILTNTDFNTIKPKELISCTLNIPFKKKDDDDTEFFTITHDSFIKIINDDTNLDKITLLKIYFYINARLSRREESMDDKHYMGGKSNSFYGTYSTICKDLKITDTVLTKYLKRLQELELVFYDNIGLLQDLLDGTIYTANNVYVVDKKELEQALKESKLYYKDCSNIVILGKKSKEETKKIIGLNGKIKQEKNKKNRNNVDKLEKKLEQLSKKTKKSKTDNKNGELNNSADKIDESTENLTNKDVWGERNPFDRDILSTTNNKPKYDFNKVDKIVPSNTDTLDSVSFEDMQDKDRDWYKEEVIRMCKDIKNWNSNINLLEIAKVRIGTLEDTQTAYNNLKTFMEEHMYS